MLRSELAGAVVADAGRPMWFGRRGERARMIASFPHLNKLPHSTLFTMRPHLSFFFFFFHQFPSEERETRNHERQFFLLFRIIFVTTVSFFLFIVHSRLAFRSS